MTGLHGFGIRSVPPCGDCYDDGICSMNCGPKVTPSKPDSESVHRFWRGHITTLSQQPKN